MGKEKKPYLPRVRTSYYPKESEIRSFSPSGDSTPLANPAVDPIVANNIASQEFDYTQSLANEGEDTLPYDPDDYDKI
ncbi:MAG: hypothetical protein K5986_06060 [Clostridium sp.]|uniref:hypothetical protein n=1 Tax=Clostridium sp. DSM 8431 TaxID=1761781 RepID=UPI0008E1C66C|nr:hypothetical protein [Clostridium sp. DSM 8431]MCR4944009.1 hypothetical protein [Clostridium sp.]SFU60305.1 hypothetical protein SAMN04487886_107116 [Clostridium sp. DSM 8431]